MKIKVEATEDVLRVVGRTRLEAKKGERLELDPDKAEIALSTGAFKIAEEETVAALMKKSKDELLKMAQDLGIEDAEKMNKEPLAEAIFNSEVNK